MEALRLQEQGVVGKVQKGERDSRNGRGGREIGQQRRGRGLSWFGEFRFHFRTGSRDLKWEEQTVIYDIGIEFYRIWRSGWWNGREDPQQEGPLSTFVGHALRADQRWSALWLSSGGSRRGFVVLAVVRVVCKGLCCSRSSFVVRIALLQPY